jgi:nucleoside-diphosphate-sugar epimerase
LKILVSGAGGFLGRHVVDELTRRGHRVRAIIRPASSIPKWSGDVEVFRADLRVHDKLESAFDDMEALVHLAAATSGSEDAQFFSSVIGTERLLDAMRRSATRRIIHVSSLVVYDWSRASKVMDEETPVVDRVYEMGGYSIAKVWQERLVLRQASLNSWQFTILRPGFIWGRDHAEIAGMGRKFGSVYVMFGPLSRLPLTHVANCADCVAAAVENPSSIGEIFNVVDTDDVRVWRYVREHMRRTGSRGVALPVPYHVGYGIAKLASTTSRLLFGAKGKLPSLLTSRRFEAQFKPIRFSNRKLYQRLKWTPPRTFDECLALTYGQHPHSETSTHSAS